MKELLESSAIMGLLGVIIGAILSLVGVLYSERIKLQTIKMEQEKLIHDDMRKYFADFLHLVNQYKDMYASRLLGNNNFMTEEEVAKLIKRAEIVIAELDIRASSDLSIECHKLFNQTFRSIFNQNDFETQYKKVVELMKKEIDC